MPDRAKNLYVANANQFETSVGEKMLKSGLQIQGLEHYTLSEIYDIVIQLIKQFEAEFFYDDFQIVDMKIIGSRASGTAYPKSDLNILVEYKGRVREDDVFNTVTYTPLWLDGILVDINPNKEDKTGDLDYCIAQAEKASGYSYSHIPKLSELNAAPFL